ncbi:MAG: sulfatase [Candidatus Zixiibacteriota bacterium]|jgi:arylsulfatase A-like enzyme
MNRVKADSTRVKRFAETVLSSAKNVWFWSVLAGVVGVFVADDIADRAFPACLSFPAAFFQNAAAAFVVISGVGVAAWVGFSLLLLIRKRPAGEATPGSLAVAFSLAFVVLLYASLPLNTYVFPPIGAKGGYLWNGLLAASVIPLTAAFYVIGTRGRRLVARFRPWPVLYNGGCILGGVVAMAGVVAVAAWPTGNADAGPGSRPNFVIITIDTLRRDGVSYYGDVAVRTPNFDAFADESLVFDRFYSNAPWTVPSMMTMLTGRYPSVHGATWEASCTPSVRTLPELLHENGYRTEAIVATPVITPGHGFIRGFEKFSGPYDAPATGAFREAALIQVVNRFTEKFLYKYLFEDTTATLTAKALRSIRDDDARPFFLWLHYLDPHYPYNPPEELIGEPYRGDAEVELFIETTNHRRPGDISDYVPEDEAMLRHLYRAETEYVDEQLGVILNALNETGLAGRTVVIVTADHGEEFFEHGKFGHGDQGPSHYTELFAVPFAMRVPDAGLEPRRIGLNVNMIDVAPTVLALAGVEAPEGLPGENLFRLSESGITNRCVFADGASLHPEYRSVRDERYTLIHDGDVYLLFDRENDGGEKENIAATKPATFERLKRELDGWTAAVTADVEKVKAGAVPVISDDTKGQIRDLGYL